MFGCCVAGRLLQTNLQQIDDTHAAFELPAAGSINHICVFLLGTVPFPEGYGATVHFFWPGRGFQLLGMLSNDKPSAIFRLRGTFTSPTSSTSSTQPTHPHALFSSAPPTGASEDVTAVLGLSIEPLDQIYAQTGALAKPSAAPSSTTSALVPAGTGAALPDASLLAERVARHLVNYVSGFVSSSGPPALGMDMDTGAGAGSGVGVGTGGPVRPESTVPLGLIARWYEGFVAKVRAGGVGFLERVE